MPKVTYTEWKDQLRVILRDENYEHGFDKALASNYWREGYSPRGFYKEILAADAADAKENFDIRYEL